MMMLSNSFIQHYICLICELSSYPYHDHLAEEPEIWEHAAIIPNMEVAVVQACRSVLNGAKPNPVYFFKKVFAVVVNFTRK